MLPTLARATATLLLALGAALACVWMGTPLPWMIGPLVATSLASIAGAPTRSLAPLRNAAQCTIGAALGLYFTPQVTGLVANLWWAILLAIGWALFIGWAFGRWLYRHHGASMGVEPRAAWATAFFSGAVGGASEMTLLAEREGARSEMVAVAHSLRMLVVTLVIPTAFRIGEWQGLDATLPGARSFDLAGLVLLGAVAAAGAWVLQRTGRANPWFMGPLVASMAITMSGVELSAVPAGLSNAAQLVIGVSLGVRFQRDFLRAAPRWMLAIVLGTLGMVVLCVGFAFLLAWITGLHPATLVLGTAPGGIVEMAITAKVLRLGVPIVTAYQVCRLVAVLVLAEPLYRWEATRRGPPPLNG